MTSEWGQSSVLRILEAELPDWVEVTARESAFVARVDVALRARRRAKLWLTEHDREGLLVRAHSLLADRPAGTAVSVRWV